MEEYLDEAKMTTQQKKVWDIITSDIKTKYTIIMPRKYGRGMFKELWDKKIKESLATNSNK